MKIKRKNKKAALPLIAIIGIVAVAVAFSTGLIASYKISQIPAFVWIILAAVILFQFAKGGKKK